MPEMHVVYIVIDFKSGPLNKLAKNPKGDIFIYICLENLLDFD